MRSLIFIFMLSISTLVSADTNVAFNLVSKHFGYNERNASIVPDGGFNETNLGIGVEHFVEKEAYFTAGYYRNSYYDNSFYTGLGILFTENIGIEGALVSGYDGHFPAAHKIMPIGGLTARWRVFKMVYIPRLNDTMYSVVGIQIVMPIEMFK